MKTAAFFPLFIDIRGKKVLFAGGGKVAERRIKVLFKAGADIIVISPEASEYIERAASRGTVQLQKKKYTPGEIRAIMPFFVIAATNDRQVNHAIALEAKTLDIPVSVADCREECTCFFPAIAETDAYIAGIISKNGDHAGVKQIAQRYEEIMGSGV